MGLKVELKVHQDGHKEGNFLEWRSIVAIINVIIQLEDILETVKLSSKRILKEEGNNIFIRVVKTVSTKYCLICRD